MLGGITLDVTEKKKVEQEARKLSHAVEQSPLSIVITDTKGDIEYVNPRFSELTGYSFEEVKGKNPRILKSNLHPKEVYKNLWNMITAGKIWKGEFRNIKKNGEAYWEAASISPIFNEKGEITHYIALKENITEKKRIEESLRSERLLLRTLIDNVPDLIYSKDINARKTLSNKADVKLMKLNSEAEALGKDDYAFFPPERAKEFVEEDMKIIRTGKPSLDTEGWHSDELGNKHWYITSKYPLHDEKGNITGLVGVGRDITDRKLKEMQLEKHLEIQSSLVELLSEDTKDVKSFLDIVLNSLIKITGSKIGYIYHYNENKREFTPNSWSKEVMKECAIDEPQSVYPLEEAGLYGEAVRQRKEIIVNNFQEPNKLKKGYPEGHLELQRFATIPVFKGNHIVAVVGVANKVSDYDQSDINNLKQLMSAAWEKVEKIKAEIALMESEANLNELNATKDKFFSIIAHDLKGPFNAMLNLSSMLLGDYKDLAEDERLSYIKSMDSISSSTYNLLENLLEWSRMQIGKMNYNPENLNVLVVLHPTLKLFMQTAKNKNIDLKYDIDKTAEIFADRYMFDTIVRNLVSNAIKFTNPGGKINVTAKKDKDGLTISVADNGVGISNDSVDGLFKIGNNHSTRGTKNEHGTGIGLLLCREMVEKHGGKIWVESEEGKGTTFTFTLPEE